MKHIIPFACTLLILAACSSSRHNSSSLTLMSYNVGALCKFNEDSAPEVAYVIKSCGADMVGLCELDSCTLRSAWVNQIEEIEGLLGRRWEGVFGSAMPFGGGKYGVGVVSRLPILNSFLVPLPRFDGSEPRACLAVETRDFWFAVTHLDFTGGEARGLQAELLSAALKERCKGKPVFLAGDFNSTPDDPVIMRLLEDWELLSSSAPTYPSDAPRVCIDHIFRLRDGTFPRVKAEVVGGDVAESASDHLPTLVRLAQ